MLTGFPVTRVEKSQEAETQGRAMMTLTDLEFKEARTAGKGTLKRWRVPPSVEDNCISL